MKVDDLGFGEMGMNRILLFSSYSMN